ncbi:ATPase F0F1 [Paenibacillus agilis]|uniref:ATPase F0F1 n=1 Tax=Paenibacillus agilis TaxID=3020863 RepID=A0A559IPE9_9BACL|nr:ATPase F0F1 [Paenibacillus agilis]TVX89505.1 ATPase F0F1 [Paenibacillus agilis]
MKPSNHNESTWRTALAIGGAGVTLILYILVGYLIGSWLRQEWEGPRIWIGLGVIIGFVTGVIHIIYYVTKFMGEQNE